MAGYDLTIENCLTCPFFERHVASTVADWLMKSPTKTGTCKHASDGRPFPWGRSAVPDPSTVPDGCPLRSGPTIVKLKVIT